MSEARRTALGRRALAVWGPTKQRLACAGECSELAAELVRDSLGRSSDLRIAEEIVGVMQTCKTVRMTLDPETFAAAELAQADKLEAKLADARGPELTRSSEVAAAMASRLWMLLSDTQRAAMQSARTGFADDPRRLCLDMSAGDGTRRTLRDQGYVGAGDYHLTPMGLAVREAGMRP